MLTLRRCREADKTCERLDGPAVMSNAADLQSTSDPWWIDLQAANDVEIAFVFGTLLPVHSLTLEDITRQRRDPQGRPHLPKVEEFDDHLFVVVNPLLSSDWPVDDDNAAMTTQLAAVLTTTRLVTFREGPVPAVDDLHHYLDRHAAQSQRGPDYLFHIILDSMVDEYVPLLDAMAERLDDLEEEVFHAKQNKATLPKLLHLKRRLSIVRKTLTYEREVLARMCRGDFDLISEHEAVYYRNVYDHLVRFSELTESSRDMVVDLLQMLQAVVSNRLNEIMKALTMVSTIVLPMTVIAGIYGMNFENLPEVKWRFGYYWALALMALAGLAPLAWFRWKRWL